MKQNLPSLAQLWLRAQCWARRVDGLFLVAFATLVLGTVCVTLWLPELRHALSARQEQLRQLELKNKTSPISAALPVPLNAIRMQQFYDNLGESGYEEQQLKTLFDIAAKNNLKLNQGEYKSVEEKNSDTNAYQILLPVNGPYPAIREFCEAVLLSIPFASLDEISFKREAINNQNLDANLRFTLYLNHHKKVVQP